MTFCLALHIHITYEILMYSSTASAYSTACDKLQENYDKLICLPVTDLLPSLFAKEVVNFYQKQRADVKCLHTERMGYILDLIIDSLKAGVAIKYNNFLEVLKESKDLTASKLVKSLCMLTATIIF